MRLPVWWHNPVLGSDLRELERWVRDGLGLALGWTTHHMIFVQKTKTLMRGSNRDGKTLPAVPGREGLSKGRR